MQTKTQSLVESTVNTLSGFLLSWLVQITLIPWILGIKIAAGPGFVVTGVFTVISLGRSYFFRRIFNRIHTRGL